MIPDRTIEQALHEFRIFNRDHSADWFSAKLFALIMKADLDNLRKIEKGFPKEVRAVKLWREHGEKVYEMYGMKP